MEIEVPRRDPWSENTRRLEEGEEEQREIQFDNITFIIYTKSEEEEEEDEDYHHELRSSYKDFNWEQYRKEMKQYAQEVNISDGFDVGSPPPSNFPGYMSDDYITCYHKPPHVYLPDRHLDHLRCLSNLAICLYNMHQGTQFTTYYDSVQVLKAMNFGPLGEHYNITFQASLPARPPATFQTRVFTHILRPCHLFEIVFVRKFKGKEEQHSNENQLHPQEIDFTLDNQNKEQFPGEHLSDFDLKDTHKYAPYTDSGYKLPLYLSQLALNHFNMDRPLGQLYHNVNVLNTKKSLAAEEGATYLITFEASLPRQNPQTFQTKIPLSPLVPTTKIKIKSVTIMPN